MPTCALSQPRRSASSNRVFIGKSISKAGRKERWTSRTGHAQTSWFNNSHCTSPTPGFSIRLIIMHPFLVVFPKGAQKTPYSILHHTASVVARAVVLG